jgi:tetratricopeptide (TPR) repeat protein
VPKKIKQERNLTEAEKQAEAAEKERSQQGIQDEFQAKGFELVEWTQENRTVVMGLIAVILVAGVAYAGVQLSSRSANEAASNAYVAALEVHRASLGDAPANILGGALGGVEKKSALSFSDAKERAQKAREAFQKVVDEHSGTDVAAMAELYLAQNALTLEDYDGAVAAYERYLAATEKSDPLRFLGLDGYATALDAKGRRADAIKTLDELIALPAKVNEDVALLRIARLYRAEGKTDDARRAAERLATEFPDSPLKPQADELLSALAAPTQG